MGDEERVVDEEIPGPSSALLECVFGNCSRTFDKKWRLEEHICTHTGERPFLCNEPGCEKSFVRQSHLQRHSLSHSDERPHSCSTCNSSFKVLSNLRKHERIHEGKKPYACHVEGCEGAFLKKTQLYAHLKSEHDIDTPFTCDTCNANFTTQSHLNRHTHKQHLSRFMCTDCYEMFDKFSALQKHIGKMHKKKPFCGRCSLTFKSLSSLNSHMSRVHMSPDSGVAGSSSHTSIELNTEVITPDEVYGETDGANTDILDGYHKVVYSQNSKHNDIFTDAEPSQEPIREEIKPAIKSFECPTCHQLFSNKSVLTKHLKALHNTIPVTEYKCSECSSVFKHKPNLVKHIQSKHKGIKRFKCTQCPRQFYYKHAFERHVNAMHSGKEKERTQRIAWNKTSHLEDISGHFVDDRVRQHVENMKELGLKRNKVSEGSDEELNAAGS